MIPRIMRVKLSRRAPRRHVSPDGNPRAGSPGSPSWRRAPRRPWPDDAAGAGLADRPRNSRPGQGGHHHGAAFLELGFPDRDRGGLHTPPRCALHRQDGALSRALRPPDAMARRPAGQPPTPGGPGGADRGDVPGTGGPPPGGGPRGHPQAGGPMEKRIPSHCAGCGSPDRAGLLRQPAPGGGVWSAVLSDRRCRGGYRGAPRLLRADSPARRALYGFGGAAGGGGGSGTSELNMSRVDLQLPSLCFLQLSRYFPESAMAGAPGGRMLIVWRPRTYARSAVPSTSSVRSSKAVIGGKVLNIASIAAGPVTEGALGGSPMAPSV